MPVMKVKKTPAEVRAEAGRMLRSAAGESFRRGDEEGSAAMMDMARAIERIRLTKTVNKAQAKETV